MKIVGICLIAIGSFVSLLNWIYLYQSYKQKRFISSIPLFGGLFLALGFYFLTHSVFSFLAILADYGNIICLGSIPCLAKDIWQTFPLRIKQRLISKSDTIAYTLTLFKSGVFIMKIDLDPPRLCNEYGAKIISDNMQGKWKKDNDLIRLSNYRDNRELTLSETSHCIYLSKEYNYPKDKKYNYDFLDNIEFRPA